MNEEILIRALIQKANDIGDDYLSNEKLVRMIVGKNSHFENYEQINDILEFLKTARDKAKMSERF